MAEQDAVQNVDDAANSILSLLDTDGADGDTGAETTESGTGDEPSQDAVAKIEKALEEPEVKADAKADAEAKQTKSADTETKDEAETPADEAQAAPPIDPPVSWKAEEKERFKALPPETQKYIVSRESEREAVITKAAQEKAEAVRQAKAASDARQQDRNLYASNIDTIIAAARQLHPILAEGDALSANNGEGWRRLAAQDEQGAKIKWADYQALNGQLTAVAAEASKARSANAVDTEKQDQAAIQAANESLSKDPDLGPIWADTNSRAKFQTDIKNFLVARGFEENLLHSIRDPRIFPIAKLAMERAAQTVPYDELLKAKTELDKIKAQQAQIAAKKVVQPGKTVKPQAAADDGDDDGKMKAALSKARKTGRMDDAAALIASAL
jgi:hypothetical protein